MTNEKYVEEIYYEAHELGFIDLLREKVENICRTTHMISHTEAVFKAYEYLCKNGLIIAKT
jgi:hypothetical protein